MDQRSHPIFVGFAAALTLCACEADGISSVAAEVGMNASIAPTPATIAVAPQPVSAGTKQPIPTLTAQEHARFALEGVSLGMNGQAVQAALDGQGYTVLMTNPFSDIDTPMRAEIKAEGKQIWMEYLGFGTNGETVREVGFHFEPEARKGSDSFAAAREVYASYVALYGEPDVCLTGQYGKKVFKSGYETWSDGVCTWTQFADGTEETLRWAMNGRRTAKLQLRHGPGLAPINGPEQVAGPVSPFVVEGVSVGMTRSQIRAQLQEAGYQDTVLQGDSAGGSNQYGTIFERENPDGTSDSVSVEYDDDTAPVPHAIEVHADLGRPGIAYEDWKAKLVERYGAPDSCTDPNSEPSGMAASFMQATGGTTRLIKTHRCKWTAQAGDASDRLTAKLDENQYTFDVWRRADTD